MHSQIKQTFLAIALAAFALVMALPAQPVQAVFDGYALRLSRDAAPLAVDRSLLGSALGNPQILQVQQPTQPEVAPVITSTPNPDGSVIHVVGFGQTLIMIANAYGLTLDQLRKQNNMSGDLIFEGRKLIIQGSSTPTLTPTVTLTPRPLTSTPRPTRTATRLPTITSTATVTATATPKPFLPRLDEIDTHTLGTIIVGLSGVGLVLVVASFFRKKKN